MAQDQRRVSKARTLYLPHDSLAVCPSPNQSQPLCPSGVMEQFVLLVKEKKRFKVMQMTVKTHN